MFYELHIDRHDRRSLCHDRGHARNSALFGYRLAWSVRDSVSETSNPIGISIVRLLSVGENVIRFENPDMLDGTPLLDIKPYVAAFDRVTPGREGWFAGKSECAASRRSDGRFKEN